MPQSSDQEQAQALRATMQRDLVTAMKARDAATVSAIRTTFAELDNATAVDASHLEATDTAAAIAGAHAGLGAAEATRRELSVADMHAIITGQITERDAEAATYAALDQHDAAERLRAEADALRAYIEPAHLLATYTTLRLGGPARAFISAATHDELIDAVRTADAAATPLLILGGGSNLVVADAGFDGTVVHVAQRGIEVTAPGRLVVQAGEPWDDLVAYAVAEGLSGIESLSGIPGSTGATPIQNVGAYGASVADVVTRVRVFDRTTAETVDLAPAACAFAYRSSAFKSHPDRYVVLEVEFQLDTSGTSAPIRYAELARRLDVELGARADLAAVRAAVLELRRGKGMVVDPTDVDSVSAGSFFTNPILDAASFAALRAAVHERLGSDIEPPAWPETGDRTKTSAAWLIERAGFTRGYGAGAAGISSKHTLALVNRGGATTADLVTVAREIRDGVRAAFGVTLHPEPVFVGVTLDSEH